jgi:acyl-CoA synthetase (AMP-forming)/AMP-acid ligase II
MPGLRLANALIGLGVQRGDRVAILAQNCPEYMEAYAAGELAGWTTVTINFRLTAAEVAYILGDSRPKCVIVEAQFIERLASAAAAGVQHVLTFGGPGPDLAYEEVLGRGDASRPQVAVEPNDIAHLIYTSGTTASKGDAQHRGQMQSALSRPWKRRCAADRRPRSGNAALSCRGQNQWLSPRSTAARSSSIRAFRPSRILRIAARHRAT